MFDLNTTLNASDWLTKLQQTQPESHVPRELGLQTIQALLAALGQPHHTYAVIHVGGTNGKGSVCAMLTTALEHAGFKTAMLTSPHLVNVRERIRIGNQPVSEPLFTAALTQIKEICAAVGLQPSYFEVLVATGFLLAAQQHVDVAVVEVGLGGRLDATNVFQDHPQHWGTLISSIGLDHQDWLGDTLSEIATEKAGIFQPGVPVFLGANLPIEAQQVLTAQATSKNCPLYRTKALPSPYKVGLLGEHQRRNGALVHTWWQQRDLPQAVLKASLEKTQWPGRFQVFPAQQLVLDGAHNDDGFEALTETLCSEPFSRYPWQVLATVRRNRSPQALLQALQRCPNIQQLHWAPGEPQHLYWAKPPSDILLNPSLPVICHDTLAQGWQALQEKSPHSWGLVCGSLYTVGWCLEQLAV